MPGVLVFGDITVDLLGRLDRAAGLGEDNLAPALEQQCGGVGANTAVALARWGVPARLLGCAGLDAFGGLALDFLGAAGVDISSVQRTDRGVTGLMFIAVGPDGQRTIFGSRGANALLAAADTHCLEEMEALHLTGYNFLSPSSADAAWRLLEGARRHGLRVSLDVGMEPSRRIPGILQQAARRVDTLFVGQAEALAVTGKPEREAALAALKGWGAPEVLVKTGGQGSLYLEAGAWNEVPPFPVAVVDTTGAGDAFAGAYLRARLRNWPVNEAALLANAAGAAASVTLGTGAAMPAPRQVQELIAGTTLPAAWEGARAQVLERLSRELSPARSASSGGS